MNTLDYLAELLAKAPLPLSTKILATSGGMANEVLFQVGDVMDGGRSVQLPGNYSHLIVAAIIALPALLEIARAAALLDRNLYGIDRSRMTLGADLGRLHDALAKLPKGTT